jgi:hypothetical protein
VRKATRNKRPRLGTPASTSHARRRDAIPVQLLLRVDPGPKEQRRSGSPSGDKPEASRRRRTPVNLGHRKSGAGVAPDASSWAKAIAPSWRQHNSIGRSHRRHRTRPPRPGSRTNAIRALRPAGPSGRERSRGARPSTLGVVAKGEPVERRHRRLWAGKSERQQAAARHCGAAATPMGPRSKRPPPEWPSRTLLLPSQCERRVHGGSPDNCERPAVHRRQLALRDPIVRAAVLDGVRG